MYLFFIFSYCVALNPLVCLRSGFCCCVELVHPLEVVLLQARKLIPYYSSINLLLCHTYLQDPLPAVCVSKIGDIIPCGYAGYITLGTVSSALNEQDELTSIYFSNSSLNSSCSVSMASLYFAIFRSFMTLCFASIA